MVQFGGPHGKVTVAYLRQGGLSPPGEPVNTFEGKTVVVTGCASGIGYEAALKLAAMRPKLLILGTRTIERGEATKKSILHALGWEDTKMIMVVPVEYTMFESVCSFTDTIKKLTDRLDGVILSAGLALPTRETTDDGWATTFKVNVLSPTLISLQLLPLLRTTAGSVLEFVNSISYCNVTSDNMAPLLQDPEANVLEYFNDPKRWTVQNAYYEAKLMVMFVVQGLAEQIGGSQGKLGKQRSPLVLASCPGQCRTNLYRNFPIGIRWFMRIFNTFIARSAEQGSRTLVSGLQQGEEANGRMWVNDQFDDWSPGLTEQEWNKLQKRAWRDVLALLGKYQGDPLG